MTTEFRSKIVLDAEKATAQAVAFGKAVAKSSTVLDHFQKLTKKTTQGGAQNVFRKYENSASRLNIKMRDAVVAMHSMKDGTTATYKELDKLTLKTQKLTKAEVARANKLLDLLDNETKVLATMVKLNQKYDENARVVAKAKRIRNELNLVVASGLKTKKEAVLIFNKEVDALRKSTSAYKANAQAIKKTNLAKEKEKSSLDSLRAKYDKNYAAERKLLKVESDLDKLQKKRLITHDQKILLLKKEKNAIDKVRNSQLGLNKVGNVWARIARNISIATRLAIGAYVVMAGIDAWVNISKTAESVDLLKQKLDLFTGESGSFQTFFDMTQEVGIKLKDAGRIMTRFAIVTDKTFSVETLSSWVATLTKSARATGTTTQEMTGALIQITQAMSAGRLMGDEYRSVTENLPLLTVALRKVFKDTGLSLKELSSKGLITNKKMIQGIELLKEMVEGIPGATGTIEAKINALSSAWDNFINKLIGTDGLKITIDVITNFVNLGSDFLDSGFDNGLQKRAKKIEKLQKLINRFQSGKRSFFQGETGFAVELKDSNIEDFKSKLLEFQNENSRFLMRKGVDDAEAAKIEARMKVHRDNKLEKIKEERAKKDKEFAAVVGSEKIANIKRILDLEIQAINDSTKDKIAPRSKGDANKMIAAKNRKFAEAVLKINLKSINEKLRIQKLSASIDTDDLRQEKTYSGNITKIKKELAKDIKDINTQFKRSQEESNIGAKIGSTGGVERIEKQELISKRTVEAQKAINKVLKENQLIIDGITAGGKGSSKYERYLFDVEQLGLKQEKSLSRLKGVYEETGDSSISFTNTLTKEQSKLNNEFERQKKVLEETFTKSISEEFSQRIKAANDHASAVERLNNALIHSKNLGEGKGITQNEFDFQSKTLKIKEQLDANAAMATDGTMSQHDQMINGMIDGFDRYGLSVKTTYEQISDLTQKSIGGMAEALTTFVTTGKSDFRGLALSIVNDLIKIQIQQALTKAFSSISGSFFADGASFNSSGVTAFASGGTFTNSVVDKPTLFPFAKGTGLMGEAGPEAIMPLSRDSSGKLGVTASKKDIQSPVVVPAPVIKLVNVIDKEIFGDYLASESGEQLILNVIDNNPERFNQ